MLTASGKFQNLDRVLLLTFAFFIMFTSFMTCQSITPKIMKELGYGNIGFINLAIIYGSFCLFSLLSVYINRKLGHRMTLFLSSSLYAIWAFVFMLPAYKYQNKANLTQEQKDSFWLSDDFIIACSLISAFLLGLGAGPLWVS